MVPSEALHVTVLFVVAPETVAVRVTFPFVSKLEEPGDITIEVTATGGAVTLTETDADLLGSATLVAVIMCVPGLGAVYPPADVMVPSEAFHVTALFVVPPETVAVKVTFPFVVKLAEPGDIAIEVTAADCGGLALNPAEPTVENKPVRSNNRLFLTRNMTLNLVLQRDDFEEWPADVGWGR